MKRPTEKTRNRVKKSSKANAAKSPKRVQSTERLVSEASCVETSPHSNKLNTSEVLSDNDALIAELEVTLQEENKEKDLLIEALHETLEDLERSVTTEKSLKVALGQSTARIHDVLKKIPDYFAYDDLQIVSVPRTESNQRGGEVLRWSYSNLCIKGYLIQNLEFNTVLKDGIAGLIINPDTAIRGEYASGGRNAFFERGQRTECVPIQGPLNYGTNKALSTLGTRDWEVLQALVPQMISELTNGAGATQHATVDTPRLISGLERLKTTLTSWPSLLRYDAIELQNVSHGERYHGIQIRLINASLGSAMFPELTYTISTVDSPDQDFGQNPRLEFPESCRTTFQNWFAESVDQKGERLEVRFASPAAIDTDVWDKLSDSDKHLLVAIIADGPSQIAEIAHNYTDGKGRWDDWMALTQLIKDIFQRYAERNLLQKDQ